ncbi:MAG: histidine triad nucleotide-binding protein [Candidatus Pacebacteria bacterium]|nr:histidine triad nucleotide-binding protein [Candidatus Paceibacterota bacterium]
MDTKDCIFCKIINNQTPSEIVYEDEKVIAFNDIYPKAPVHILVVPKKHIISLDHIELEDKDLVWNLISTAKKIAKDKNLSGYKLLINIGRKGGQIVDHLHIHLMGDPNR